MKNFFYQYVFIIMLNFDDSWSSNLKHNFLKNLLKSIWSIRSFYVLYFIFFMFETFDLDLCIQNFLIFFQTFNSFNCCEIDFFRINQRFQNENDFFLIMTSIELLFSSIHLISVISRRSYDWRKFITSIINCFFSTVFDFIKHWYNDLKSMQTNEMSNRNIFFIVIFEIVSKSNLWINSYNSKIKTFWIIRLHLIKNQCKMLTQFDALIEQIT